MVYITVLYDERPVQMSIEDLYSRPDEWTLPDNVVKRPTRTYRREYANAKLLAKIDVQELVKKLHNFNAQYKDLRGKDRHSLYTEFHIPKKTGGLRKIDAPNEELSNAIRVLKMIFEQDFRVLYHTCAYAYVRGRSCKDCMERHVANGSKWYAKFDFHNFFGSINMDFTMRMMEMIFPFSEVVKYPSGREELQTALSICFLDDGLPQGTPISPLLSNIVMIPYDYELTWNLSDFDRHRFVYTRYADDHQISCTEKFDVTRVESLINNTLKKFDAPITLSSNKTRFGTINGKNFNLGLMVNRDNKITVGHRRKRRIKTMIHNYMMDRTQGVPWSLNDVQILQGNIEYIRSIEPEYIEGLMRYYTTRYNFDVKANIKKDIVI